MREFYDKFLPELKCELTYNATKLRFPEVFQVRALKGISVSGKGRAGDFRAGGQKGAGAEFQPEKAESRVFRRGARQGAEAGTGAAGAHRRPEGEGGAGTGFSARRRKLRRPREGRGLFDHFWSILAGFQAFSSLTQPTGKTRIKTCH
jgi:hypothetical protein